MGLEELLMNIKLIPIRLRRIMRYLSGFFLGMFEIILLGYELWRNPSLWWGILFGILISDKLHFRFFCIFSTSGVTISGGIFIFPGLKQYIFPGLKQYIFPVFLLVMFTVSLGITAVLEIFHIFSKEMEKIMKKK